MKTFIFKWATANKSGSFDIQANSEDIAGRVANLMAIDRGGKKAVATLIETQIWS